ncbi:tRNA1(Val) (adenine(37)-N6)-methyltransferase [Ilyomonas limi]|nr:methyltransferase [Ilyomonas limi]
MKVCTDACLFGAWTANKIAAKKLQSNSILDIGAGTGLLSLMLAQQLSNSIIHATEIDADAAKQASENFAASPWHGQLHAVNAPIQSFSSSLQYDFIVSNPPFFQNDLASNNAQRNVALHSHQLGFEELLAAIQMHLSVTGHFAVLLPYHRTTVFESLAQREGFYLHQKTWVQQTPAHALFRSMLLFGREQKEPEQTTIIIKDKAGSYTDAFVALLKDYYLYL